MSNKYPSQNASANTRANRARQRDAYTINAHTKHLIREQQEFAEALKNSVQAVNNKTPVSPVAIAPVAEVAVGASEGIGIIRTALAGAGASAFATGAALAAVGVSAAAAMNHTVFCDDPELSIDIRDSRSAGRIGTYTGAVVGTAGTLVAIGASGSVAGLSGAGIAAGVVAIGSGSVVAGVVAVAAIPAAAAAVVGALGYGGYSFCKWLASSATGNGFQN